MQDFSHRGFLQQESTLAEEVCARDCIVKQEPYDGSKKHSDDIKTMRKPVAQKRVRLKCTHCGASYPRLAQYLSHFANKHYAQPTAPSVPKTTLKRSTDVLLPASTLSGYEPSNQGDGLYGTTSRLHKKLKYRNAVHDTANVYAHLAHHNTSDL